MIYSLLGVNIREARDRKRMTVQELAEKADIPEERIRTIEGSADDTTIAELMRITLALHYSTTQPKHIKNAGQVMNDHFVQVANAL